MHDQYLAGDSYRELHGIYRLRYILCCFFFISRWWSVVATYRPHERKFQTLPRRYSDPPVPAGRQAGPRGRLASHVIWVKALWDLLVPPPECVDQKVKVTACSYGDGDVMVMVQGYVLLYVLFIC